MPEWTICPHCSLKHRQRPDDLCPRCKEPLAGEVAGASDRSISDLRFSGAGQSLAAAGALPDVYDDWVLPTA